MRPDFSDEARKLSGFNQIGFAKNKETTMNDRMEVDIRKHEDIRRQVRDGVSALRVQAR